jgi:hypothetical protein
VADEKKGKKKKRHTPGRDHVRKSGPQKRKRFQRKAAKQRREQLDKVNADWNLWESLPLEVQKLRPELKPKMPRNTDEK